MEEIKVEIKTKDETPKKLNNNSVYIWSIIENIATISVTACLFWMTKSVWCFLFLINLNSITSNFKKE